MSNSRLSQALCNFFVTSLVYLAALPLLLILINNSHTLCRDLKMGFITSLAMYVRTFCLMKFTGNEPPFTLLIYYMHNVYTVLSLFQLNVLAAQQPSHFITQYVVCEVKDQYTVRPH